MVFIELPNLTYLICFDILQAFIVYSLKMNHRILVTTIWIFFWDSWPHKSRAFFVLRPLFNDHMKCLKWSSKNTVFFELPDLYIEVCAVFRNRKWKQMIWIFRCIVCNMHAFPLPIELSYAKLLNLYIHTFKSLQNYAKMYLQNLFSCLKVCRKQYFVSLAFRGLSAFSSALV